MLTVPLDLDANITCIDETGETVQLQKVSTFTYLGGGVPDCYADFKKRRALAWTVVNRMKSVFGATALPDDLRTRLFVSLVESCLLYNADTWTLSGSQEKELDSAHSSLLRSVYNIHWPITVSNAELYHRAGLALPSTLLRSRRMKLAGHLIRGESYCPQPAQKVLLWCPSQKHRRGQGRTTTYPDLLYKDTRAPVGMRAAQHVKELALRREIWRCTVYTASCCLYRICVVCCCCYCLKAIWN